MTPHRFDDDALFTPWMVGQLAAAAPKMHLTRVAGVETIFERLAIEQFEDVWETAEAP